MLDPFSSWSRMVAASLDMQNTWLRAAQTMQASRTVISARTEKMRAAASSPLQADLAELALMVPEKVEAFGLSSQAALAGILKMQSAYWSQVQRMSTMIMTGRLLTFSETSALATRTHREGLAGLEAGARLGRAMLAPIHKTATANARRLGKSGTKAKM